MSKHTPGPWVAEESEDGHEISMATSLSNNWCYSSQHIIEYNHSLYPEDGEQFKEAEANAHLIAAAPDLLAALERAVSWIEDLPRKNASHQINDDDLTGMRAAIAKARGTP